MKDFTPEEIQKLNDAISKADNVRQLFDEINPLTKAMLEEGFKSFGDGESSIQEVLNQLEIFTNDLKIIKKKHLDEKIND